MQADTLNLPEPPKHDARTTPVADTPEYKKAIRLFNGLASRGFQVAIDTGPMEEGFLLVRLSLKDVLYFEDSYRWSPLRQAWDLESRCYCRDFRDEVADARRMQG